jgi:hypothetical protein
MSDKKLILPAELKVCATCTYWAGERSVDEDVRLVVVNDCCHGECLVREEQMPALRAAAHDKHCLWDLLEGDKPESGEPSLAPRL